MADNEKNAVIILDSGKPLDVQSTIEEIESQITAENEKGSSLPVIKVVNERGRDIWINANHVVAFHEYVPGTPLVGFA